jgi:hypothetical protein
VFCVDQLPFGWSVSGPICGWDFQCFVPSNCLLFGMSAVRWMDWDVQTVFCGEQLPFGWSVSGPMDGLGSSDCVLW